MTPPGVGSAARDANALAVNAAPLCIAAGAIVSAEQLRPLTYDPVRPARVAEGRQTFAAPSEAKGSERKLPPDRTGPWANRT